ncbi:MAG: ribosome biogenesis GTPase Der [Deltaproteobacteria bacterium]|nr:ribosome biogenesis GTPase Der [Deltaproteobacteria bacterium]
MSVSPRPRTGALRVAIVGRPNVGKSTLFNRLIRKRRAITLDTPGITRDPIAEPVTWDGIALELVDTGGLGGEADIDLADLVHQHTVRAIAGSELLVVLFDVREGLSPLDRETVELVSRSRVPAIYVCNKSEGRAAEDAALEFCALGIDPPMLVSAEHGLGITELHLAILEQARRILGARSAAAAATRDGEECPPAVGDSPQRALPDAGLEGEPDAQPPPCRVAIVGRPNVGKSSLLNWIAGAELSLVDDKPGTTRDVVDTEIEHNDHRYLLLDTAGMRRPSRVEEGVERISVRRALEAVERANLVALLVEPSEGLTDQDARIARHAWSEGRALVIVINKIDLASPKRLADVERNIRGTYATLGPVAICHLSVKNRTGLEDLFRLLQRAQRAHNRRLSTPEINRILAEAVKRRDPPVLGRARVKFFYGTQTGMRPPTINVFTNRGQVPEDYQRFLERCFREELELEGTPLRLHFVRRASHGDRGESREG